MSSGQRITGDYVLETVPLTNELTSIELIADTVNISNDIYVHGSTRITGDLWVEGVTTTVDSVTLTVTDPVITLANGVATNPPVDKAGIEVDRGFDTAPGDRFTPQLYWDEPSQSWMLFDGISNSYIVTNASGGIGLQHVVEDTNPVLGGNLDTNDKAITSSNGVINIDTPIAIPVNNNNVTTPQTVGDVTIYNSGAYGFDSGLSYINSNGLTGEFISKQKALVYSLIF